MIDCSRSHCLSHPSHAFLDCTTALTEAAVTTCINQPLAYTQDHETYLSVLVQIICKNRQNSVLSNRDEKEGHLDVKFSKHTSAWMDTWGPRIVARHLAHKSFKVPDWCIDDLLVGSRLPHLLYTIFAAVHYFLICMLYTIFYTYQQTVGQDPHPS